MEFFFFFGPLDRGITSCKHNTDELSPRKRVGKQLLIYAGGHGTTLALVSTSLADPSRQVAHTSRVYRSLCAQNSCCQFDVGNQVDGSGVTEPKKSESADWRGINNNDSKAKELRGTCRANNTLTSTCDHWIHIPVLISSALKKTKTTFAYTSFERRKCDMSIDCQGSLFRIRRTQTCSPLMPLFFFQSTS